MVAASSMPDLDISVLELCSGGSGPYCGMQFGSLGARVIKLENPAGDWTRAMGPPFLNDDSVLFTSLNRNKQSVAVPLDRVGPELLGRLIPNADVLLTDLTEDAAALIGADYHRAGQLNERLVYCRITGYDEMEADSSRPTSEVVTQARSDVTRYVGEPGHPPIRVGAHISWLNTGCFAFQGVMAALFERLRSGRGQLVELSEIRSLVSMQTLVIAALSDPDERIGWAVAGQGRPEHGYRTKDGSILFTFSYQPENWDEFLRRIGLGELLSNPEFGADPRTRRRETEWELKALLEQKTQEMTSADLIALVRGLGAMAVQIHDMESVWDDPQVKAMELAEEYEVPGTGTVRGVRMPWRFGSKGDVYVRTRMPAPRLGEHTDVVLKELAYEDSAIAELVGEKAAARAQ